jgi:predicted nuclease of predicted toxin-antitoxin system
MNILLDSCVWNGLADYLRKAGHTVEWVGEWQSDPGDKAVLRYARERRSALVTIDKDFGELAILQGEEHCGIIRLVNIPLSQQPEICCAVLERYADELAISAIITVEQTRARVRVPPKK